MNEAIKIPKRILSTLLHAAGAGVVPRQGLEYIAIGREKEIEVMLRDLEQIALGACAFRFLVGKYGSGKSFLMGLMRNNACERGFVTCDCDLSPERRFQGTQGQGIATFRELIRNLSTRSMPDGNALPSLLASWFSDLQRKGITQKNLVPNSETLTHFVEREIFLLCDEIRSGIGGFDLSKVLIAYYHGYRDGDEELKQDALRWLRAEFQTRLQVRGTRLEVSAVIDDHNWYDYLKLYALFFRRIGYQGLVVFIDECVNLYKIPNRISRENNYEKILSMFNDTMQGKAEGIGFYLGATPQFVEDTRRGLFSYEALRSRLIPTRFLPTGARNLLSPLIYLDRLNDNEIFALCRRLSVLHGANYGYRPRISDEQILQFLNHALRKMGADEMITPREITRDFLTLLDLCYSDPEADPAFFLQEPQIQEKPADDWDKAFDFSDLELS